MISPSTPIRKLIQEHYGMCLPVVVLRLDDEINNYQKQHHEVPYPLWSQVNHYKRILREWTALTPIIDLVVWEDTTESYRLVQDICFKDAYMNEEAWHLAVLELITSNPMVWVVKHLD
jgi:hypothetical protein